MRPLIIDAPAQSRIQKLREFAEHPDHINLLKEVMAGRRPPPGDDARHVLELQFGFRIVYSVDQSDDIGGLWRHLSVSVGTKGKALHPAGMKMICDAFGFIDPAFHFDPEHEVIHALSPMFTSTGGEA